MIKKHRHEPAQRQQQSVIRPDGFLEQRRNHAVNPRRKWPESAQVIVEARWTKAVVCVQEGGIVPI